MEKNTKFKMTKKNINKKEKSESPKTIELSKIEIIEEFNLKYSLKYTLEHEFEKIKRFSKIDYSYENLYFWELLIEWKTNEEKEKLFKKVYDLFIKENCEFPLNLNSKTHSNLIDYFHKNKEILFFSTLEPIIYKIISDDIYLRYIHHQNNLYTERIDSFKIQTIIENNYGFPEFISNEDTLLNEKYQNYKPNQEKTIFDEMCKLCSVKNSIYLFDCKCTFCGECGIVLIEFNQNCPSCNLLIDHLKIKKFQF
jgi:hypothetical protein